MPFVLLAIGILFLVVAVRGTQGDLYALLKSEFVGSNSFVPWAAALLILGLAGYIKTIRPVTHAFLVLVILVMVLANGGKVFANFTNAIQNPIAPASPSGSSVSTGLTNPASTTLQTAPSSVVPGVANPYLPNPAQPIGIGNVPVTGGGYGQY